MLLHDLEFLRPGPAGATPALRSYPLVRRGCTCALCGVARCGAVWRGVAWCGVAWCGVVWCGVVWRGGAGSLEPGAIVSKPQ